METKMKIAIPTIDKINIAEKFDEAAFLKIISVEYGKISYEIFVSVPSLKNTDNLERMEIFNNCSEVIVNDISASARKFFDIKKIKLIKATDTIITNIEIAYINELIRKESDTCCCP